MLMVSDLLRVKGDQVWSVGPDTPTLEALTFMTEKNVGALMVLDEGLIAGIISERDFVHHIANQRDCFLMQPVGEIMTTQVITVTPQQTIEECMKLMTAGRFRHLPVVDKGKLVGLVSIGDVVKSVINEQSSLIDDLENYITGHGAKK